ncbi:hypothetical protein MPER_11164, partial [Moniliophthora perniciosa FA553]
MFLVFPRRTIAPFWGLNAREVNRTNPVLLTSEFSMGIRVGNDSGLSAFGRISQEQNVATYFPAFRSEMSTGSTPEIATFAAGCFWGVEHIFFEHYPPSQNKGILKTAVGYTGAQESSTNLDSRASTGKG